eukprot:1506565-Prymnesium_polylepis.1
MRLQERLNMELFAEYGSPLVLVVIQGGVGTLDHVLRCQRMGVVAVIAADSGKLASAIAHFVHEVRRTSAARCTTCDGQVHPEWAHESHAFEEIRELNRKAAKMGDRPLSGEEEEDDWPLVVLFYLRGKDHIGEAILDAVMRQADEMKRLQLAVSWDREDLLEQELSSLP